MVTGEDDVRARKACISNKLWCDEQTLPSYKISTMAARHILRVRIEAADLGPLVLWRQVYRADGVLQEARELP